MSSRLRRCALFCLLSTSPLHASDGTYALGFGTLGVGTRVQGFESNNQALRRDDQPVDLVVLSDGSLVAGGVVPLDENDLGSPPAFGLMRLGPSGVLDSSFGGQGSGRLRIPFGISLEMGALARDGDDRLHIAGNAAGTGLVLRYSAQGVQAPFAAGFAIGLNVPGQAVRLSDIVVLDDGRLIAAGSIGTGGGADFLIVRWRADGSLDTGFGMQGGYTRVNFGLDAKSADRGRRLLQRAGGGWLVAGTVSAGADDIGIAAFTADGQVDTGLIGTLGIPGRTTLRFDEPLSDDRLADVVELPGGRLLALVDIDPPGGGPRGIALGALTPQGFPDVAFAPQGRLLVPGVPGEGSEQAAAMFRQADAAVVIASTKYADAAETRADVVVRRVRADGSFDAQFGNAQPFNVSVVQFAGSAHQHSDEVRAVVPVPGAFHVFGRFSQAANDGEFGFAKLVNAAAIAPPPDGDLVFGSGFE